MKVSYFLTRPKAKTETAIYARLCYSGLKFKYYLPESIHPKFWNKETQRAKETQKFKEYPEFNARLDKAESDIKNIHRRFINDNGGIIPSIKTLKSLLDAAFKTVEQPVQREVTFFSLFTDIKNSSEAGTRMNAKTGKPISRNTYKTYKTVLTHLSDFQKIYRRKIDFDTIDLEFYSDYTEYLIKGKPKLSTNTIGKHIQIIKLVMNEAAERGIQVNNGYKSKRFRTLKESTDSIYLNDQEIMALEEFDLSDQPRLERVRDLFLVGCRTGLRYSDFSILKPENIKDGFIELTQTKTLDKVVIPVHPSVKIILDKYNGSLPRAISNQKMNEFLKEIAKKINCLKVPASRSLTKGGVKVTHSLRKCDLITSHTARRSFATNEYLAGTPTLTIMAITGHRTEKAFLTYIKLAPQEHAKLLKLHWQKRHEIKAI